MNSKLSNADDSSSLGKHQWITFSSMKPEMMTETATQVEEREELDAGQISNKPVQLCSIMLGWFPKAVAEDAFLLFYSWGYNCSTSPVAKLTQDLCSLSFIWDGREGIVKLSWIHHPIHPTLETSNATWEASTCRIMWYKKFHSQ